MENQCSAQLDAPECILGFAYFGSVTDGGVLGALQLMASVPSTGSPPRSAPCVTRTAAVSPGVFFFPPPPGAGGGVSAHSAGQRPCRGRGRPGGVCAAAGAPGGPSEVQNHQGQEGHGPRHVPHLLPAPGEGGREEGEFRGAKSQRRRSFTGGIPGCRCSCWPAGRGKRAKHQIT